MARVTVEDCITVIPNRFELVLLAAQRARDISAGMGLTVDRDNDKNPVVALREIAEQTIDFDELRRHIARGVNRHEDLNLEDDALLALTRESLNNYFDDSAKPEISEVGFEGDADAAAAGDEDDDGADEPTAEDIASVEGEDSLGDLEDLSPHAKSAANGE